MIIIGKECEICGQRFDVDEEWLNEIYSEWYICPECRTGREPSEEEIEGCHRIIQQNQILADMLAEVIVEFGKREFGVG